MVRESVCLLIGDDIEQLFNALASDQCDDAKLGKMGMDCVDHRGLLTDEQMARVPYGQPD